MKSTTHPLLTGTMKVLGLFLVLAALLPLAARAHPYASCITGTNATGDVTFYLNESGANVTIVYEDGTTNATYNGAGAVNFAAGGGKQTFSMTNPAAADSWHSSFRIYCFKQGTGTPTLISSDTFTNSVWSNACGVAINKNPKIGTYFGRIYAGNSDAYSTGPGPKAQGIYAMYADQTLANYRQNPDPFTWFGSVNGNFKSPGRMRVAPDNSLLVADSRGAGNLNRVYAFGPDLSTVTVVLGPSPATGAGDIFGTPCAVGTLAQGNLVLYVPSAGIPVPVAVPPGNDGTNCIKGPLTSEGSFNCIFRYNIGSGPLPWNKRPDYAYTVGLDGIAQLRPEVDIGPDGKIYAGFGRANLSNPNLQILRPSQTTNGIYGDPVNKAIQDAMKDQTNWLYTSGVTPPYNSPPAADPWNGSQGGSGGVLGTYGGVRMSPDGQFFASMDNNNAITWSLLDANGLPIDSSISGIANGTTAGNQAGLDWDAADNIWALSRKALPTSATGQAKLRCYSLGMTTTCISSNDWTGTNGTFQFIIPGTRSSLVATTPNASQNYTNNCSGAGAPIPGVFRISLNTPTLSEQTTVTFTRGGTATYFTHYTINTNETPNGVIINPSSVIFPSGTMPGGGNWSVDVKITPTAVPVSGETLTVTARLNSGTNSTAFVPLSDTVAIINTGPQLLQLAAASPASLGGMNRGIPNDQARFRITRLGDTNGPGNSAGSVSAKSYTVTNINYYPPSGSTIKAESGLDYTAGVQNFTNAILTDGGGSILIPAGATTITAAIGNPVKHTNTSQQQTNLQVVINLTNQCSGTVSGCTNNPPGPGPVGCNTNCTSLENYAYQVDISTAARAAQTLSLFDNANGGETLMWSNPLTNSLDSTNWTLVFASVNQGAVGGGPGSPAWPLVISNYDNSASVPCSGGQPYIAAFGKAVSSEAGESGITVPLSDTMTANGWTTALKLSINKDPGYAGEAGLNLYPQRESGINWSNFMTFNGNYALRFDMFLSLYQYAVNNPTIGTPAREFVACGVNHRGTNANWRLDINPRAGGTGAYPINADGEWISIGAASGSVTPADYDLFISPPWALMDANGAAIGQPVPYRDNLWFTNQIASPSFAPFTNAVQSFPGVYTGATNIWNNAGVPNDQMSQNNNGAGGTAATGIIKNPPFQGINSNGGAPDNEWVDVSLEVQRQTNVVLKLAQQQIFQCSSLLPTFGTANPIAPFSGVPMLGYLDPNKDISDCSGFVYISNLRVVELSPFIPWTNQLSSLIVTQGSTFVLSSAAIFASNPLTNIWWFANTNGPHSIGDVTWRRQNGTPLLGIETNTFAATNGSDTLTVNNIQSGTNFMCTWSDQAGWITNLVSVVEVIAGPGDTLAAAGSTTSLTLTPTGNRPPTGYQWKFNGANIANSTHYAGATAATLFITNVTAADAGVYSNLVANPDGSVVAIGTLTVVAAPTPANLTNFWGSTANFTISAPGGGSTTYQWKKGGVNLNDGGNVAGATTTSLTLSPVTTADQAAYTVGVTNSLGGVLSAAANLWVVVPPPTMTNVTLSGGMVLLGFKSTNSYDTSSDFTLQTSPLVQGPYTNVPGTEATFSGSGGAFLVTWPQPSESSRFFRLRHISP